VKMVFKIWIGLLGFLVLSSCQDDREYEDKEIVTGYRGQASRNPYLVAERFLSEGGVDAKSMKGVVRMDDSESVVFAPASSIRSTGDGERILEWILEGGHFVCFLERGEDFWKDVGDGAHHNPLVWSDEYEDTQGVEIILDRVGLELGSIDYDEDVIEKVEVALSGYTDGEGDSSVAKGEVLPAAELIKVNYLGDEVELLLGGKKGVKLVSNYVHSSSSKSNDEVKAFHSLEYGLGRVTIISEARLFRNPYLKMADHAEMLDLLVDSSGEGKVVFSLGKVRSFTSMLREYAWMAVLGVIVLTAMWLWKNLPKYGPTLDKVDGHYRDSSKHMLAVGNFFWTHKRDDALIQPLRDEVVRRSGGMRNDGYLEDGLMERLAEISGLNVEDIQEAMTRTQVNEASLMVKITKNLQQLLKSL